jgi:glyoxylase-like metal-dependent hydrolase (beta-lactamase superfamily II)
VPLPGHTRGHSMIAVKTQTGWLLHCGDAYLLRGEVATPPKATRGVSVYQAVNSADRKLRAQNIGRLRELVAAHGDVQGGSAAIEFFCAHDPEEFNRLSSAG